MPPTRATALSSSQDFFVSPPNAALLFITSSPYPRLFERSFYGSATIWGGRFLSRCFGPQRANPLGLRDFLVEQERTLRCGGTPAGGDGANGFAAGELSPNGND